MKYKYIVGLLVALSLNNAFAADEAIDLYQDVYGALTTRTASPTDRINAALQNNENYDNKKDGNLCRSILAGFALRKTVFELNATELQTIVEAHNAFFKTSLGMSLVYGWTQKHFAAPELPYYIVGNFSFGQHFKLIADQFTTEQTKTFLKSTFTLGLAAVNADQDTLWEFYSDAISALCVVESISSRHGTLSMDGIIEGSYLTKEEAKAEAKRISGRADHLWIEDSFDTEENNLKDHDDATALVSLQQLIIQKPDSVSSCNPFLLETLLSLPTGTDLGYRFLGKTLEVHLAGTRGVANGAVVTSPQRRPSSSSLVFVSGSEIDDMRDVMGGVTPSRLVRRKSSVILSGDLSVNLIDVIAAIKDSHQDVQAKGVDEALEVLKDNTFLTEGNFPSKMSHAQPSFIKMLARHAREIDSNFMTKSNEAYQTVITYPENESLTGMFVYGTPQKRANITAVKAALIVWLSVRAETLKQQIAPQTLPFPGFGASETDGDTRTK